MAASYAQVTVNDLVIARYTADAWRGRVYAVNSMVTITSNQLGDFRAGAAASLFGTVPSVLIGGCCTMAVVLISTKIFRGLYQADRYEPAKS